MMSKLRRAMQTHVSNSLNTSQAENKVKQLLLLLMKYSRENKINLMQLMIKLRGLLEHFWALNSDHPIGAI